MSDRAALPPLAQDIAAQLAGGFLQDPFSVLGPQKGPDNSVLYVFLPGAEGGQVLSRQGRRLLGELVPMMPAGLFAVRLDERVPYLLRITWPGAGRQTEEEIGRVIARPAIRCPEPVQA